MDTIMPKANNCKLSKRGRLGEGRPFGTDNRIVSVRFLVTTDEAAKLKQQALAAGLKTSAYIRGRVLGEDNPATKL